MSDTPAKDGANERGDAPRRDNKGSRPPQRSGGAPRSDRSGSGERPSYDKPRSGGGAERKPWSKDGAPSRDGGARPPRDGERKPWMKDSGSSRDGAARPARDGERKPWMKDGAERPARDGDRPYTPRPQRDGDKSYNSRPQRDGDRPNSARPPRDGDRQGNGARPPRDGDRPYTPRPQRDGDKPYGSRPARDGDRPYNSSRPARDGDKPYGSRPQRDGDRPYNSSRPARDGDKPYSARPQRDGDKPYNSRPARDGDKPYGSRPPRDGDRPYTPRPQRDGDKPFGSRPQRDGDRPHSGSRPPRDGERKLWTREGAPARGDRDAQWEDELTDEQKQAIALRPVRSHHEDPELPYDVSDSDLDRLARNELKTLTKDNAEWVAKHLAMAARLIDTDPELAHRHVTSAARRAGRIAMVRETLAISAYVVGDYALALRELRTYRRISGKNDQLPLMVDSERAVGRPDRALELGRSVDRTTLAPAVQVALAIAMSGARLDLGQSDAALLELEIAQLDPRTAFSYSPDLFAAYAEVLEELGRDAESQEWRDRADVAAEALGEGQDDTIDVFEIEEEEEYFEIEDEDTVDSEASFDADEAVADVEATDEAADAASAEEEE